MSCYAALKLRLSTCNGAEENQVHCCDSNGPRVQKQPLFLVCYIIAIFTLWPESHRSENSQGGGDQK